MNIFKTKILSIAISFCLLGMASYASSKRPAVKPPFTVAVNCKEGTVSWTGVPSGAGSIALFATSETQAIGIAALDVAIANIPATRSMVTATDIYPTFTFNNDVNSISFCLPMLSPHVLNYCHGDLEITAFAIESSTLVRGYDDLSSGKIIDDPSATEIRDLAASQALAKTSIKVQCLGKGEK